MFHVKHLIEEYLKELKIQTNNEKPDILLLYLEELIQWNKKINLISRKLKKEDVLKKLLLPSLIPYEIISGNEKILDFGAGAGIAGIPLKIFKPGIELHLLESKHKTVIFLEYIASALNLNLKILNKFVRSAEDIEESYDWVLVRALDPEKIPEGTGRRIIYYGKYTGDKLTCTNELNRKDKTISILEWQCFT
jgi:16S rRNA (guanine527-N7)-methyltransferase